MEQERDKVAKAKDNEFEMILEQERDKVAKAKDNEFEKILTTEKKKIAENNAKDIAISLIQEGLIPDEKIAFHTKLTLEQVSKLRASLAS